MPPEEYCYVQCHCGGSIRPSPLELSLKADSTAEKLVNLCSKIIFPSSLISFQYNLAAIRDGCCMRFNHPCPSGATVWFCVLVHRRLETNEPLFFSLRLQYPNSSLKILSFTHRELCESIQAVLSACYQARLTNSD